ncbi:MAG: Rieske 2Fe-2S domain-containing protein, partial [Anaerolineales bacterium]
FVDYVGRSHTSHGADPKIYIPQRYVIGMVGFVQRRIMEALEAELHAIDHDFEVRATKAWNAFLTVVLEMLSRGYGQAREEEDFAARQEIDDQEMLQLSVDTYERALGIARVIEYKDVFVARPDEIPEGQRKIVEVEGLSIGVFHHKGQWVALHNSCLHRGGPVCTGTLEGDTLTCPWHGYQYDVNNGRLLLDPSAHLTRYPVEVRADGLYLRIKILIRDEAEISLAGFERPGQVEAATPALAENEFLLVQLRPGEVGQVHVSGEPVAVYNVDGTFYATHDRCTHAGGPLSQGKLDGHNIICPWHDSCFDVTSGAVTCGPAKKPVKVYQVVVEGGKGIVKEKAL